MMKKQSDYGSFADKAAAALAVILFGGIRTFFSACGPKEDGSWMTCHQAEQAITAMALAILVQTLIPVILRQKAHGVKTGLCIAVAVEAAVCALVPGVFIRLCMMETMHCHTMTRPFTVVICGLLTVSSVLGAILHHREDYTDPYTGSVS